MVEQSAVNRLVVGSSPTWGVFTKSEKMNKNSDELKIANKLFTSHLMLGTGKYKTMNDDVSSIKVVSVKS